MLLTSTGASALGAAFLDSEGEGGDGEGGDGEGDLVVVDGEGGAFKESLCNGVDNLVKKDLTASIIKIIIIK